MKKVEFEYTIRTSPTILFACLSTPSGLSEWFADDVNIKNDVYTFFWSRSEESATLIKMVKPESIRFKWDDDDEQDTYFEMSIRIDDLTKDVALIVTDFVEEGEEDEKKLEWDNNINSLKQVIGA